MLIMPKSFLVRTGREVTEDKETSKKRYLFYLFYLYVYLLLYLRLISIFVFCIFLHYTSFLFKINQECILSVYLLNQDWQSIVVFISLYLFLILNLIEFLLLHIVSNDGNMYSKNINKRLKTTKLLAISTYRL